MRNILRNYRMSQGNFFQVREEVAPQALYFKDNYSNGIGYFSISEKDIKIFDRAISRVSAEKI